MQSDLQQTPARASNYPRALREIGEPMPEQELVHVVDDDEAVRQSLHRLLHATGYDSALYDSADSFLAVAPELRGGCLLLDLKMPKMGGFELQRWLTESGIRIPVIVMTGQGGVPTAVRAIKAGATDFIEKPIDDERLLKAIGSALATRVTPDLNREAMEAAKRLAALSPRERTVLEALVTGQSNKQIAHDLRLSVRTVEAHRARMLGRLKAHGLAEAVRLAVLATLGLRAPSQYFQCSERDMGKCCPCAACRTAVPN
jgi:two-component system response regulator FixJ